MPNVVFRPRVSERTPSKTFFAELCTAPGPQTIGVTGDNSFQTLFGREWLLEWSVEDDHLRLYQESATHPGEWERVVSPLPPVFDSALPVTARRVSFAFDQSARMIVAYEDEGVVKVTRWDPSLNQYVQNVSFAGVDPVVVMDATWVGRIPGSDVLLFYLSVDRTKVLCRVQAQTYGTEHELHEYDAPVILDRAVPLTSRYQLLVADADGTAKNQALVSSMYPLLALAQLGVRGEFLAGEYDVVARTYEPTIPLRVSGELLSGALTLPVSQYESVVGAAVSAEFTAGALRSVVSQYAPTVAVEAIGEFAIAELAAIGARSESTQSLVASGEFTGGTYEPG